MSAPRKTLEFFLNYACNAKCPFCFNPPDASPELEEGLPFARVAERLYAGHAEGYRALKFIGGEVTVRDDLPRLLRLARKIGFEEIQITTNGVRLGDEAYAAMLVEAGADSFRFSLHGHTPELHDRLVAVPGALEKAARAVGHLRRRGLPVGINYVLNRLNAEALPETLLWFYEGLGLDDVIVYFLRFQGFGAIPANKELLKLRMSEAVPHVRRAFARLGARRRLPTLIHFPPCAAPELRGRMLDWTRDPRASGEGNTGADSVILPDDTGGLIHEVTSSGKAPIAACAACALKDGCLGVERNYLDVYGDAEFVPVRAGAEVS